MFVHILLEALTETESYSQTSQIFIPCIPEYKTMTFS